MDKFLTISDFKRFSRDCEENIEYIDILVAGMSGIFRGKRIPASDIDKLIAGQLSLPRSVATMDIAGATPLCLKEGYLDGDPDTVYLPLKHSLAPVSWSKNRAQIMVTADPKHESTNAYQNPRAILAKALELFHKSGLFPQAAIELEFFLIDPASIKKGILQPPKTQKTNRKVTTEQCLGMQALEDFSPFLDELQKTLKLQNLNPEALSAEYSHAQFELNQPHGKDLLYVCDQAMLLKHTVKSVARQFGVEATFMAKPYLELPGSGMHVHCSVLDKKGKNIFSSGKKGKLSQKFFHAVGGLSKTARDFFPLFAPTGNSYRRFMGGAFAPVNSAWGYNNRSVALRVPLLHGTADSRIEHRIAGADACPYLTMAAVLFGIDYGMKNKVKPPKESVADKIYEKHILPWRWGEALYCFKKSAIAKHYLGVDAHNFLHGYYASEYEAYHSYMPKRDIDRYLESL